MGDTVKAAVGIALIVGSAGALGIGMAAGTGLAGMFGGTLASAYLAGGAVAMYATAGAIALVGASLVGGALTPDIPDFGATGTYAGQKLQTRKTNNTPVPICYGRNKIAGNIIWESTGNQINADSAAKGYNRDYWAVIALTGHQNGNNNNVYANDELLTHISAGYYYGGFTAVNIFYTATSINLTNITFLTTAQTTQTGANLGMPSIDFPAGCTYIAVQQVFDAENNANTQLKNILVDFDGKPVRTISGGAFGATTNNPSNVEIVADILTDLLEVQDSAIDLAKFQSAKDAVVSYGLDDANVALVQQVNIQSVLQDVLASGRLQLARSVGKWVLIADKKAQSPIKTLTEDDIINGTISINMAGNNDIANSMTINYINPSDEWLKADWSIEDADLVTNDGRSINRTIDVKAVTNLTQAQKLAEISFNSMRYSEDAAGARLKQTPISCSFGTTTKHADIEVGDVIAINHFLLDRVRKFVVLAVETDQSGIVSFSTREYCNTHYKDSLGVDLI